MDPAFLVRFRPLGPWRIGPDSGARNRVDRIYHSDSLFSAVTHAMARLGRLDDWLAAEVGDAAGPAVRFSSLFPFLGKLHFVVPPRTLWPPQPSAKVRWKSARFVPLEVVETLAAERPLHDNAWTVDGLSECLLPAHAQFHGGPFRAAVRSHAAVDRVSGAAFGHQTACLEFAEGAGLWAVAGFRDEAAYSGWDGAVRAAFRLLADAGFGGERSIGWGRSEQPEFVDGALPDLLLPPRPAPPPPEPPAEGEEPSPPRPVVEKGYWLLSLFSPAAQDAVDWQRGSYSLATRGGRVDSPVRSGDIKKTARMVEEGSVLAVEAPPVGAAPDVAPEGFAHPVYRAGFALAVSVPLRQAERPPVGAS